MDPPRLGLQILLLFALCPQVGFFPVYGWRRGHSQGLCLCPHLSPMGMSIVLTLYLLPCTLERRKVIPNY